MSVMERKILQLQLEQMLYRVTYEGASIIFLRELYRLLGRGNRAAGTWVALLDAWEGIGRDRRELQIAELYNEVILLTCTPTTPATDWAGETDGS